MKKLYWIVLIILLADQIQSQPLLIVIDNEIGMCSGYQKAFIYMTLINNTNDTLFLPGIRVVQPSYPTLHAYLTYNKCVRNCKLDSTLFVKNKIDEIIKSNGDNIINAIRERIKSINRLVKRLYILD